MKRNLNRIAGFVIVLFSMISCEQNAEMNLKQIENEGVTEIELLEQKTGVTFFKQDVIVRDASGENTITMWVASKSEAMLKTYLQTISFSISPVYSNEDQVESPNKPKSMLQQESNLQSESVVEDYNTNGVFIEVLSQTLHKNVSGLRTDFKVNNRELGNGRTAVASDFPNEVHHYNTSGRWPERFKMFAYQTVGYKFMGKSNRLSGWSTRTFCNWYNDADCNSYWEHASEKWINVDGPWEVRAQVHYFFYTDYSFEWNNF